MQVFNKPTQITISVHVLPFSNSISIEILRLIVNYAEGGEKTLINEGAFH